MQIDDKKDTVMRETVEKKSIDDKEAKVDKMEEVDMKEVVDTASINVK